MNATFSLQYYCSKWNNNITFVTTHNQTVFTVALQNKSVRMASFHSKPIYYDSTGTKFFNEISIIGAEWVNAPEET